MEQRIPISAKQFASARALIQAKLAAERDLTTYCNSILDALPARPAVANVRGLDDANGVFEMVLDVPSDPQA